ncbi:MAG: SRPBCC family protein [Spirochaetes bacterium]|nr:SRPBCC family protein [Spirochaetota bacterium]
MTAKYKVSRAIEVDADPEVCYALLCDFEKYPAWFKYVRETKVLRSDEKGIPNKVMFLCDVVVGNIVNKRGFLVVNEYEYDHAKYKITYKVVDGIVKEAEGYYQFRRLMSGKCLAVFYIDINFGSPLPQKIINFMIEHLMDGVLAMIKSASEKLVKGAPL